MLEFIVVIIIVSVLLVWLAYMGTEIWKAVYFSLLIGSVVVVLCTSFYQKGLEASAGVCKCPKKLIEPYQNFSDQFGMAGIWFTVLIIALDFLLYIKENS